MRAHMSVASAVVLLALGYAASPYVALWRVESALDHGDTAALERSVDWRSVREGIKEDILNGIIGPVQTQAAANSLPQFGASFIAGIADAAVERDVTPQNLIAVMRQMHASDGPGVVVQNSDLRAVLDCFAWAFFDGPTAFNIVVNTPGSDPEDAHLRLRMELHDGSWRVMRAWIPQDIVERASQRT